MLPKGAGALYILNDKLQLYSSLLPTVLELHFPQDLVRQKIVVSKERLEVCIATFIETNNIPPSNMVLVIANSMSYIKSLSSSAETPQEEEKAFLDEIPFKPVVLKRITTPLGTQLYAVNQELFTTIKEEFEKHSFPVEYVLPGLAFSNNLGGSSSLTPENASIIFQETFTLSKYNLLANPEDHNKQSQSNTADREQRKKDIFRLYALVNFVGVMTIIFLVTWNKMHPEPQTNRSKANDPQISITPTIPSTPSPTKNPFFPTLSIQETKDIKVKIIYSPTSYTLATELNKALQPYNFEEITLSNTKTATSQKNNVIFSPKVSSKTKAAIMTEARKAVPNITSIISFEEKSDITIIITN